MRNFLQKGASKMPDLNTKKNKHMSLDDRIEIQSCLDHAMTFKAIARRIGKDQTTISKEVKKHITVNPGETITRFGASGDPVVIQPCPLLLKAPFVRLPIWLSISAETAQNFFRSPLINSLRAKENLTVRMRSSRIWNNSQKER